MFLLIDNYDSFTYNLWHYLGELGAKVEVRRNDALSVDQALALEPEGIVISPGPCDPDRAGICLDLIKRASGLGAAGADSIRHASGLGAAGASSIRHTSGMVPMFGVCLGQQAMGQAFGGRVVRAPQPMHGKVDDIFHDGTGCFAGLPSPFRATRYHSLVVDRDTLPACLHVSAWSKDGLIMGLAHKELPVWGVQFHPESIETEHGHAMLRNFVDLCRRTKGNAA